MKKDIRKTIKIDSIIHEKLLEYCRKNDLKVKKFVEKIIKITIDNENKLL